MSDLPWIDSIVEAEGIWGHLKATVSEEQKSFIKMKRKSGDFVRRLRLMPASRVNLNSVKCTFRMYYVIKSSSSSSSSSVLSCTYVEKYVDTRISADIWCIELHNLNPKFDL